jgi:hypothetical protein
MIKVRKAVPAGVVAVALAGGLLVGCGGAGGDPLAAPTVTAAVKAPAPGKGFEMVEVPDFGFAIAVPKTWRQAPLDPAKVRPFVEANPQFGLDPDKPLATQFQAYATDGSGANVNVLVNPVGRADLDDLQRDYTAQIAESVPGTEVKLERIRISGREGLRGTYQLQLKGPTGPRPTTTLQYIVIGEGRVYIATVSLIGRSPATRLAEKIGRSLFLL